MKNKYFGIILLILTIVSCKGKAEKDTWAKEAPEIKHSEAREKEVWGGVLRGSNPALYFGTPLYELAEVISGFSSLRDNEKTEKLIDEIPKEFINFQEGKYGMTIGQFALRTNNMFAIRKLMDKGLNPNLIDKRGSALIIDINGPFKSRLPESMLTLKYMIEKGGDVNLYSKNAQLGTPLIEAANSNFENVKVLVEAGANPHFIDEFSASPFESPLSSGLASSRIDIVNYLIFDQKVDFRTLKYPSDSKFHPGEYVILHKLREMIFDLNSKEYREKMKLVAYLKRKVWITGKLLFLIKSEVFLNLLKNI